MALVDERDAATFLIVSYLGMNENVVAFGDDQIKIEDCDNLHEYLSLVQRASELFNRLGKDPLVVPIAPLQEFLNSTEIDANALRYSAYGYITTQNVEYARNALTKMLEFGSDIHLTDRNGRYVHQLGILGASHWRSLLNLNYSLFDPAWFVDPEDEDKIAESPLLCLAQQLYREIIFGFRLQSSIKLHELIADREELVQIFRRQQADDETLNILIRKLNVTITAILRNFITDPEINNIISATNNHPLKHVDMTEILPRVNNVNLSQIVILRDALMSQRD
ncbi:Hypothetical protein HVR_LOCUS909 [uncultured virus]|nr:Hypothetical protein HVR_LOCUS909 [uncultured virus]